jgi:hypothetical protein
MIVCYDGTLYGNFVTLLVVETLFKYMSYDVRLSTSIECQKFCKIYFDAYKQHE